MLDARVEIASDFSVLHRVDDPMRLPSSRYFEFAELLPSYQGAVRLTLMRVVDREQGTADQPRPSGPEDEVSPAALASMSNGWIEFTGG